MNRKLLNALIAVYSVFCNAYSSDVVVEVKQNGNYIVTCGSNTKVSDNVELLTKDFNDIAGKYLQVNFFRKVNNSLIFNKLRDCNNGNPCTLSLKGNSSYRPDFILHITGNSSFEKITGDNVGACQIYSDNDIEISNMITEDENHNKEVIVDDKGSKAVFKRGSTVSIVQPYFSFKLSLCGNI